MALQLWLIRHAPVLAPSGICYGASDLAADPKGTEAAARNAAALLPANLPVFSSPLQRCTALARHLHKLRPDLGVPKHDARLAEMDFGHWEGYPWNEVPQSAFDAWMADFADHAFGGSESTQGIINRLKDFVLHLTEAGITQAACVCHAGSIRALHYLATNGPRPIASVREWPTIDIPLGTCLSLHLGKSEKMLERIPANPEI